MSSPSSSRPSAALAQAHGSRARQAAAGLDLHHARRAAPHRLPPRPAGRDRRPVRLLRLGLEARLRDRRGGHRAGADAAGHPLALDRRGRALDRDPGPGDRAARGGDRRARPLDEPAVAYTPLSGALRASGGCNRIGCELVVPAGGYDAFRRARTTIWLALRARHLALAAAGTRQAHTYHRYASACRAPAATTRTAPAMRRTHRPEPLAPQRAEHVARAGANVLDQRAHRGQ